MHKCNPQIDCAQSVDGDNPWIDCAKRGSEVCAIQSTDGPNPNFAPNIYTVEGFLLLSCNGGTNGF